MQYMDIKPRPKNGLEAWDRWANWMQSQLLSTSIFRHKIQVLDLGAEVTCTGYGHFYCAQQGYHSWFNHAQDGFRANSHLSNYPPGFQGEV